MHRMMQLEEQRRIAAAVLPSKALLPPNRRVDARNRPIHAPEPTHSSFAASSLALMRSPTAPELSSDMPTTEPSLNMHPEPSKEDERDSRSSTSLTLLNASSVAWPVRSRDRYAKSSEEIERARERTSKTEKKIKDPSQASKARKRLSKKPPVAMATQGYMVLTQSPAAPHHVSSTNAGEGPSKRPKEARRSSTSALISNILLRSSSSQPPTPVDTIPRPTAQAIKTSRNKSQQRSRHASPTRSSSEDEVYVKELVDFACEMGHSAQKAFEADVNRAKLTQQARAVTLRMEQKAADQAKEQGHTKSLDPSNSQRRVHLGKQDNAAGGYRYPNFKKLLHKQRAKEPERSPSAAAAAASPVYKTLHDRESSAALDVPGSSGVFTEVPASYVQQHRHFDRERAIARLEDELAIQNAMAALLIPNDTVQSPSDSGTPRQEERADAKTEKSEAEDRVQISDKMEAGIWRAPRGRSGARRDSSEPERKMDQKNQRVFVLEPVPRSARKRESRQSTVEERAGDSGGIRPKDKRIVKDVVLLNSGAPRSASDRDQLAPLSRASAGSLLVHCSDNSKARPEASGKSKLDEQ